MWSPRPLAPWSALLLLCCGTQPEPEAAGETPIGSPPKPAAVAFVKSDRAPLKATLDGTGSGDPDGDIATYAWDLGDGASAEGPRVEHVFEEPGTHTVKLTVTDAAGNQASSSLTLVVLAADCPVHVGPEAAGKVASKEIGEASGLVSGRLNPEILWVHNDSGDTARIFAIEPSGKRRGTFTITGADAVDWEDMAVAPGPMGESWLYLGDIGDNQEKRASIVVWKVREPLLGANPATVALEGEPLRLKYPDGAHNAEVLLVDPITRDLYIVTKRDDGLSGIYRLPAGTPAGDEVHVLERVGELEVGGAALPGSPKLTAGDVRQDGSAVILRTYTNAFAWVRPEGPLHAAFVGQPCANPVANEAQGETIAFTADGAAYFTISEGANPTIYRYPLPTR